MNKSHILEYVRMWLPFGKNLQAKHLKKKHYCDTDVTLQGHLCLRCKKSLNLRFGKTKFSCYDYGAEFNFYRRRNILRGTRNLSFLIIIL